METIIVQPSFFALCVSAAILAFVLRFPPPPSTLAPLFTLLGANIVVQGTTWMWGFDLTESSHWLVVASFYVGSMVWVSAWLVLALRFSESQGHRSQLERPWLLPALWLSAGFWIIAFLSNPWHELLITPRVGEASVFHPAFAIVMAWGLAITSVACWVYLSLATRVRSSGVRARALAVMASGVLVMAGSLYQLAIPADNLFSPGQGIAIAAMVLIVGGIYGTRLFALSPVGLHRVIASQADGILLVDDDGLLLYANPSAERMIGSGGLQIDSPVYPLLASRLRDTKSQGNELDADDLRSRFEAERDSGSGTLYRLEDRWLRIAVTRIPGVGSRARVNSLLLSDQTAIQEATDRIQESEAELRRSEERYRILFEESPLGVIVVDRELKVQRANRALCELVGAAGPAELQGLNLAEFGPPEELPIHDLVEQALSSRRPVASEQRWVSPWGRSVQVRIHVVGLAGAAGEVTGILGILEDVSEQHRLQDQLVHAQKMDTVGRLAGGVAHDFNNFLTVILGNAELLMHELRDNPEMTTSVVEIAQAAEHSASLTRQLLAFSRKQVFQPRVVDVSSLVTEFDRMLRRVLGEPVTLETVLSEESLHAVLDSTQLEVVLLNLAINARDAMPGGGTLTIVTSCVSLAKGDRGLPVSEAPGDYVLIEVADTGHGMETNTLERIFEPFFTTKAIGEGTGLGLSTVYGIIQQSGGFTSVESQPGKGSCFRIHLPLVEPSPEADAAGAAIKLPHGTGTILLVEDEGRLRLLANLVLEEYGYTVIDAMDGHQALERIEALDGKVDLLVTDLIMPRLGGVDLAARLRARYPGLKVLFMSGYADRVLEDEDLEEPGVEFLQKPFTPSDLLVNVSELLSGSAPKDH